MPIENDIPSYETWDIDFAVYDVLGFISSVLELVTCGEILAPYNAQN